MGKLYAIGQGRPQRGRHRRDFRAYRIAGEAHLGAWQFVAAHPRSLPRRGDRRRDDPPPDPCKQGAAESVAGAVRGRRYVCPARFAVEGMARSEEHTSELQSLMRISYAVFCLKKKKYKPRQ